jgi:hypothetical protein
VAYDPLRPIQEPVPPVHVPGRALDAEHDLEAVEKLDAAAFVEERRHVCLTPVVKGPISTGEERESALPFSPPLLGVVPALGVSTVR